MRLKLYLLAPFIIFSSLFFSFKITEVPPGINGDEVPIGFNAILISKTLHDENGRLLPIFFSSQNLTDFKQPVTTYTTALAFKIFGPSYQLMRQISVFFILISLIVLLCVLSKVFDLKFGLVGTFLFMTIPIVMIQSHLALENIAPLPFISTWLLLIYLMGKGNGPLLFLFTGATVGLNFYSYPGMRLVTPVLIFLTYAYIFYLKRKKFLKFAIFFTIGYLPFLGILPVIHKMYPGAILAYNRPSFPQQYQQLILPYLSSFDLSFLFLEGDSTPYHSTGKHGMFLLATLPLFLTGCFQAIRSKNSYLIFTLITFFLLPIFYGLTGSIHRASRLMVLIPSFVILSTLGFKTLTLISLKYLRNIILVLTVFFIGINYIDFLRDYWFEYPSRAKVDFANVSHTAFKNLYEKSKELNLTPIIQRSVYQNEKPGSEFFEQVYFPGQSKENILSRANSSLKTWDLGEQIPKGVILLHHQSDAPHLLDQGLKSLNVEMPYYNLSVNR